MSSDRSLEELGLRSPPTDERTAHVVTTGVAETIRSYFAGPTPEQEFEAILARTGERLRQERPREARSEGGAELRD